MQSQVWFWNENNLSKSFLCFDYILNILGLKTWIRLNFLLRILLLFPRSSLESCSSCATQKKELLPGSRFVSLKRGTFFEGAIYTKIETQHTAASGCFTRYMLSGNRFVCFRGRTFFWGSHLYQSKCLGGCFTIN